MTWTADTTVITADSTYATADGLGQNVWQIVARLINDGLIVYPDIEWVPNTASYGNVLIFIPGVGSVVRLWTTVQITASLGTVNAATTTVVPNCIALQSYQATQSIAKAQLLWGTFQYVATGGSTAPGYVIAQTPSAGTITATGTTVTLSVAIS